MPSQEDISQQLALLTTYRRSLSTYIQQLATVGGIAYAPPGVINGIRECRDRIRQIKDALNGWGVQFENLPDDEETIEDSQKELTDPSTPQQVNTETKEGKSEAQGSGINEQVFLADLVSKKSIMWAIDHLITFGDTDLFPKSIEFENLKPVIDNVFERLQGIKFGDYVYGPVRRFIVPKDEFSYRTATQLDPLDNLILVAIVYQYGDLIEKRRVPDDDKKVFSYRFLPNEDGRMFNSDISWISFWTKCKENIANYRYAIYLDIADFYNQIYHNNIDHQLAQSGLPDQIKIWLKGLLENSTNRVPRGIPVGPHATHILGELSLIPIDNSLLARGFNFCRFVDDIVIFCDEYKDAKIIIYQMADILDKQQKLIFQRQKTKIFTATEFEAHCSEMIQDRPINKYEEDILSVVHTHSEANPYTNININKLSKKELALFTKKLIENVLKAYLDQPEPNYTRLRWLLRRLSQFGIPSAIEFCIKRIEDLTPAISDVCYYLISSGDNYKGEWKVLGKRLLDALQSDLIKSNEYFQLSLLSIFSSNPALNHTDKLIPLYQQSPPSLKREILLSLSNIGVADWVREVKESYNGLDLWSKRAFIIASRALPVEERRAFLTNVKDTIALNDLLIKWSELGKS